MTRLLVAFALLATVGCASAIPWVTSEPAPWSYVEDAWGGVRLGAVEVVSGDAFLLFELRAHEVKRIDSGICVRGASTRMDGGRIALRLDQSLCGPGSLTDYKAALPKLAAGTYDVVYDDEAAGFPALGRVRIPQDAPQARSAIPRSR